MKLSIIESKKIKGGTNLSGTIINALVKGINSIMDVGRYLGSSIRRSISNNICPF